MVPTVIKDIFFFLMIRDGDDAVSDTRDDDQGTEAGYPNQRSCRPSSGFFTACKPTGKRAEIQAGL